MAYQTNQPGQNNSPQQPQHRPMDDFEDEGGTYGDPEKELLLQMIDTDALLLNFERRVLRGLHETTDFRTGERQWVAVSPNSPPVLNELGVRELLSRLIGIVSTSSKLTYRTEEEMYKDAFYADMSFSELIAKRANKWEMDIETAKAIKDACMELIWSILSSSRLGFTAINIRSTYSRSDVVRSDSQSKEGGKSFLGLPMGGRK